MPSSPVDKVQGPFNSAFLLILPRELTVRPRGAAAFEEEKKPPAQVPRELIYADAPGFASQVCLCFSTLLPRRWLGVMVCQLCCWLYPQLRILCRTGAGVGEGGELPKYLA